MTARRRPRLLTFFRYARTLLWEFRVTLGLAGALVTLGTILFATTPHEALGGRAPSLGASAFAAWMALFGEPTLGAPETWYLGLVAGAYPLIGLVLIGEGVVHLGLLMVSRRRGEKEWMRVMAATYRDHVILCGAGRLGIRVLEGLLAQGADVLVLEKAENARFLPAVRQTGVPVLIRDMTDDAALEEAGVAYARCIILATNDDMANLEAATDARRMNPTIRVCLRMFDQKVAGKLAPAFGVDAAFSASALAAPTVVAMAMGARVLSAHAIAGTPHVVAELPVAAGSPLVGHSLADIEAAHHIRIVAHNPTSSRVAAGDTLIIHAPVAAIPDLTRHAS